MSTVTMLVVFVLMVAGIIMVSLLIYSLFQDIIRLIRHLVD